MAFNQEIPPLLPERLQSLRAKRRLSMNQVDQGANLGRGACSRYESGNFMPTVVSLWALADFYGTTVDWLIGRA